MERRYIDIDFEFTEISEPTLRLVCCSLTFPDQTQKNYWLDGCQESKDALVKDLLLYNSFGYGFSSFAVEAEARCFLDLGLNPLAFNWCDLFIEFLMLMNHDHRIAYGKHLIDGKVKDLKPFVDEKGKSNLVSAVYKMLGVVLDSEHKNKMRDLIISSPLVFTEEEKNDIMAYCASDTKYLTPLRKAIMSYLRRSIRVDDLYFKEREIRARYSCHSAIMVKRGYPINVEWARNLSNSIEALMDETIRDINTQFPDIEPFGFKKAECKWKKNESNMRDWIVSQGFKDWPLTDGGKSGNKKLSLAIEAWTDRFDFKHSYPRNNFGAQMVRYFKLNQSLNGFRNAAGKDKKTFWDYVGSDGRVRPYYGIYVAQSSRSQPLATGYVFLKPAWQRSIVQPPPGKMIIGCDYSSEEILLKALLFLDRLLTQAYASGDVYLAFGKDSRILPKDATKKSHNKEREYLKHTVLGLSYLMTEIGLAKKLTSETGRVWTEEECKELVVLYEETYWESHEAAQEYIEDYFTNGYAKLKDGWYMWGDNTNKRSIANMPIQGAGADIMRRWVELCHKNDLPVIMTLHDALYVEVDSGDMSKIKLFNDLAKEAFISYFKGTKQEENAKLIRTECYAWSPDFEDKEIDIETVGKVALMNTYIDDRAVEEFETYKKYLFTQSSIEIL